MNHTFGRRAATTAVALAAVAGTLLTAGGAASAAPNPAVSHATVSSHAPSTTPPGNHHGDRGDGYRDGRSDRNGHHGDRRWDGHRRWERDGRYWYSDDHGHRYRFDNHRFYQWERGTWVAVTGNAHGFDHGIFR